MSDIPAGMVRRNAEIRFSAHPATDPQVPRPARRRRRGLRIVLVTLASFVVLIGAVTAGGYFYLSGVHGGWTQRGANSNVRHFQSE